MAVRWHVEVGEAESLGLGRGVLSRKGGENDVDGAERPGHQRSGTSRPREP